MNRVTALPLLKLALEALERDVPNVDLARGVLREVVGGERTASHSNDNERRAQNTPQGQYAVTIKRAAELLSLCTKTVRHKIARGEIPAIGTRRTTRVLMPDALHALARGPVTAADPIAEEAIAFVHNRTRLRSVVGGSGLDDVVRPGQTRDTVQDEAESAAPKREKR
jgi:hypothetical protein